MKQEKLERIEAIKAGKFGVEVEMYNIERKTAAELVANYFGTSFTVRFEGGVYDKWTCKDGQGRKWTFMRDASIHDIHGGCEMVTPVLSYSDIEALQEVIRVLRRAGAKSDPNHECGIHVHIDATGHTPATIRNLTNLMTSHDVLIMNAIGVDDQRRRWCRPVDERFVTAINAHKPTTMDEVKKAWYETQDSRLGGEFEHYNHTRYNILNLHSLWQNKGIEFRCFQFDNPTADRKGGLHAGQLKAYIQLCLAINTMALKATFARNTATELQVTDPKKAMYKWMRRAGMRGEEFATARALFTRNLEAAQAAA